MLAAPNASTSTILAADIDDDDDMASAAPALRRDLDCWYGQRRMPSLRHTDFSAVIERPTCSAASLSGRPKKGSSIFRVSTMGDCGMLVERTDLRSIRRGYTRTCSQEEAIETVPLAARGNMILSEVGRPKTSLAIEAGQKRPAELSGTKLTKKTFTAPIS